MPYKRNWPDVLWNFETNPYELFRSFLDNQQAKAVFTGAVLQTIAANKQTVCHLQKMRFVKNAYFIENGFAFDYAKKSQGVPISLLKCDRLNKTKYELKTFYCLRKEKLQSV